MITERELDRALELKDEIKDLKIKIAKLDSLNVAVSNGASFSIDGNRIDINSNTLKAAREFRDNILKIYNKLLQKLEKDYQKIVVSEESVLEDILLDGDSDG